VRREKEVEWGERRDKLRGYNWNEKKKSRLKDLIYVKGKFLIGNRLKLGS